MNYNKVRVSPKSLHYIAPANMQIGDNVICTLKSGEEFEGTIKEIVERHVQHSDWNCSIRLAYGGKRDMDKFKDCIGYATVKYKDSASYTYAHYIYGLEKGDIVVTNNSNGLRMGTVAQVIDKNGWLGNLPDGSNEIVAIVDMSSYENRIKSRQEVAIVEKEIEQYMLSKATSVMEELLAEKDPEFASLLNKRQEYARYMGDVRD